MEAAAMMFELKTLSPEAVPRALAKAERYRLLNEPGEAESICLDALRADAENQDALTTLLLALTDQFDDNATTAVHEAQEGAERIRDDYDRAYSTGIIWERRGKARVRRGGPDGRPRACGGVREGTTRCGPARARSAPGQDDGRRSSK